MSAFIQPKNKIHLTPRRQSFNFKGLPKFWHGDNAATTHLFNATSFGITVLEDIFIKLSRELLPDIKDDDMRKEMRAFIGQEAHHSRSHHDFNDFLRNHGYDVDFYEALTEKIFCTIDKVASIKTRLAICIAAEHFTAMFAHYGLKNPEVLAGSPSEISRLFKWHAVEEVEHKSVLFNLYLHLYGDDCTETVNSYLTRITAFVLSSSALGIYYSIAVPSLMNDDKRLFNLKDWKGFGKYLFKSPALAIQGFPYYMSYFMPKFQPWEHDDSHMVNEFLELVTNAELYETRYEASENKLSVVA